jgi:hypothetical protein
MEDVSANICLLLSLVNLQVTDENSLGIAPSSTKAWFENQATTSFVVFWSNVKRFMEH